MLFSDDVIITEFQCDYRQIFPEPRFNQKRHADAAQLWLHT